MPRIDQLTGADAAAVGNLATANGAAKADLTNTDATSIPIGGIAWITDIGGDIYISVNASYSSGVWNRVDVSKPAWLAQFDVASNLVGESYKALTFWRCEPAANPIGDFTTVGGWLLATSMSEFSDFTVGGFGVEFDGNGTTPYGRVQHGTYSGEKRLGLVLNAFLDDTNRDDASQPCWFLGFVDAGDGGSLKLRYAPAASGAPTWTDLLVMGSNAMLTAKKANQVAAAKTASWTLAMADIGVFTPANHATVEIDVTIPPNSSVPVPIGAEFEIGRYGAAEVGFVAGAGVMIRSENGYLHLNVQYSRATATKIGTDEWWLRGSLKA